MFRRACSLAFLSVSLFQLPSFAQAAAPSGTNPADNSSEKPSQTARQSAMNMLEAVLAGTGSLQIPQNRLAIELRAFPILWARSDPRARALISQMAGEYADAASRIDERAAQNPTLVRTRLRQHRISTARTLAQTDPECALLFLSATLPFVQSNLPDDDPDDHALIFDLAAQVALHDPRRALQLAEQQLKESVDLPQSLIDLLEQVQRSDAQAGARLFRDIVDHLKQQDLSEDSEELTFAVSLLTGQFSLQSEMGRDQDTPLRSLAELVAATAASSNLAQEQPFLLRLAFPALDAIVPAKSAALHSQIPARAPAPSSGNTLWQQVNQARSSGDGDKVLAALAHVPEDDRPQLLQQVAWSFANEGNLQITRQIAANLDPWQRNNLMQQAIRTAALAAGSRADFAAARQLTAQITDDDSRATLLSDLAIYANGSGTPKLAEEMLGEAASLVLNRPAGISAFAAQLTVAQAYLRVKPAQALPMLERSASQLEQALLAASQLDGFLPDQHSFEGSELILNEGFLYQSLIEPYANAAAELASLDLPAARALADRLPLPEARLMTELFVADGALDRKDKAQTTSSRNLPDDQRLVFNGPR